MKSTILRLVGAALAFMVIGAQQRVAAQIGPDIHGNYLGFAQVNGTTSPQTGPSQLSASTYGRGTFKGTFSIPGGGSATVFAVNGKVDPDTLAISGDGVDQDDAIAFDGRIKSMGDGSVHFAAIRFRISAKGGKQKSAGIAILNQMQGGPQWANIPWSRQMGVVAGNYIGTNVVRRNDQTSGARARLAATNNRAGEATSALQGSLGIVVDGQGGNDQVELAIMGTAGPHKPQRGRASSAPFSAVCLSRPMPGAPNGIIAILIGVHSTTPNGEQRLRVQYRLDDVIISAFKNIDGNPSKPLQTGVLNLTHTR